MLLPADYEERIRRRDQDGSLPGLRPREQGPVLVQHHDGRGRLLELRRHRALEAQDAGERRADPDSVRGRQPGARAP